jgi:hypothetical protein
VPAPRQQFSLIAQGAVATPRVDGEASSGRSTTPGACVGADAERLRPGLSKPPARAFRGMALSGGAPAPPEGASSAVPRRLATPLLVPRVPRKVPSTLVN